MDKNLSLKLFGLRLLDIHLSKGFFWIRFFGRGGFKAKDLNAHFLLFGERYGYVKYIKIGNWAFSILKTNK